MFRDLSVGLDAAQRMPPSAQIQYEPVEDYAELADNHPSAHPLAAKQLFDSDACEPNGSQDLAIFPRSSIGGKRKPKNQTDPTHTST